MPRNGKTVCVFTSSNAKIVLGQGRQPYLLVGLYSTKSSKSAQEIDLQKRRFENWLATIWRKCFLKR